MGTSNAPPRSRTGLDAEAHFRLPLLVSSPLRLHQ